MAEELKTQILPLSNSKAVRVNGTTPATRVMATRGEVELGLHKPHWYYGQPLVPHLFQQAARYHERHVESALRALLHYPRGVIDLKLDEQALASGHVAVQRFSAIMPDGLYVEVGPNGNASLPPRSFEPELRTKGAEVDVYVGIPFERSNGANAGNAARFTPVRTEMRNFNTGKDPIALEWLSPNLQQASEPNKDFAVLRIARLRRTEHDRVEYAPDFAPPTILLHASPVLEHAVVSVAKAVDAARMALQTQRAGNLSEGARTSATMTLGLVRADLTRVLGSRTAKAWEGFDVLVRAVSALAVFEPRGTCEIPTYQHDAPGPGFVALANEARRVLYWVAAPPFRPLPLSRTEEERVWAIRFGEPGVLGKPLLLAISGADPQSHQALAASIRVAALDELQRLVGAAVLGVPLVLERKRIHGLPVPAQSVLFRFDTTSPFWQRIATKSSLAIAMPPSPPGTTMELSLFVENERA